MKSSSSRKVDDLIERLKVMLGKTDYGTVCLEIRLHRGEVKLAKFSETTTLLGSTAVE